MAPRLADRYLVLLRHGDTENDYGGDGSRVIAAIVMDAVNRKVPKELVYKMLADPRNKGGFAGLHRRRNNLERWFESVWTSAERRPVIRDRQEAVYRAQELLDAALAEPWPGRGKATDIAVLTAVVAVWQRVGRVSAVQMSVRELAELAKVNHGTVIRSLRRLTAGRWLRVDRRCSPCSYSLGGRHRTNRLTPVVGHEWCSGVPSSDVFRWGGLGLSAQRVFASLDFELSVPAAEIAASLGVTPRTVRRHLVNLAVHGLAVRDDAGWVRGRVDLEHVADELGMSGASFAQKRRHQNERAARNAAHAARSPGPPATPATDLDLSETAIAQHHLRARGAA